MLDTESQTKSSNYIEKPLLSPENQKTRMNLGLISRMIFDSRSSSRVSGLVSNFTKRSL